MLLGVGLTIESTYLLSAFRLGSKMKIGIDYDSAISADEECFAQIVEVFRKFSHEVIIVTSRAPSDIDGIVEFANKNKLNIIFTNKQPKMDTCKDIDIWIDDMPMSIVTNQQIYLASKLMPSSIGSWTDKGI
jgi:hypothetical protein